ncbi:hypothetical protein EV207_12546 [Scopulibacillus darangshiensis]|uniref:Uncharacterized protein n=1 Tax=Scopulibacillus darangshiensis TaxID=442528 RepID=A0A4V2SLR8_9BACL|nr:hypothetical protein [Scopulibacillus darangshiensis]TCP24486.1 hypothetical protein EV207_12546 [Scopulibacillus darangshiensis]
MAVKMSQKEVNKIMKKGFEHSEKYGFPLKNKKRKITKKMS